MKRFFLSSAGICVSSIVYSLMLFFVLDTLIPFKLPDAAGSFAVTVTAEDGTPLRAFPDSSGVWRYPVTLENVSPLYIEALINYEDRYFFQHPGVNPLALMRAAWQFLRSGRFLSGGSTLTMQTPRILNPYSRSFSRKFYQIFRALQLESRCSKKEILTLYLNYAPFGGPVEGVQAAAFTYLGKSAIELSHAEAALLAVLPQSPTRMRPDRHPKKAEKGRNKVLDRMAKFGVWDHETVESAKIERVIPRFEAHSMTAPLLARRLKSQGKPSRPVVTCIDPYIQITVAEIIRRFIETTPDHTSAAALVVENRNLAVRAYVGSADFLDNSRFGHVDMVQAVRSPGSTLKPFLYGIALEEGLIHSESLLVDAPLSFSGYRPDNFTRHFTGPVSAAEALRRSLNLPAVDLLDRVGPKYFDVRLRQAGLHLMYPPGQKPNLTLVLGGVGATLEKLVSAYTSLARGGMAGKLRLTSDEPVQERRLLSEGAAYIIRQILQETPRPDLPGGSLRMDRSRQAAWKTGTSYGFRDAWTIGVNGQYTIGVWAGRPDGTPSPGQYGRATAAPLLFRIIDSLPRRSVPRKPPPESVTRQEICWPLGLPPRSDNDSLCHERRHAWVLHHVTPPTFPDRADRHWQANPLTVMINPATGLRVEAGCPVPNPVPRKIARWPKTAMPWLPPRIRAKARIPRIDPVCGIPASSAARTIRILGIEPETVFRPPGAQTRLPTLTLQAEGGEGSLFWFLNGDVVAHSPVGAVRLHSLTRPGRYKLTVMDLAGNYDTVSFVVLAGGER